MSSLTKTWAETPGASTVSGFNLAVITDTYMNLHLRLGYHFNLVDARMEPDPPHNHIYFRFVGGVTDITRRSRRAGKTWSSGSRSWAGWLGLPGNWIFNCAVMKIFRNLWRPFLTKTPGRGSSPLKEEEHERRQAEDFGAGR